MTLTFGQIYVKLTRLKSHGEKPRRKERLVMRYDNSHDRRIFARIRKSLPIRILAAGQDEERKAETVDISAHGIGIESKDKLSPQTRLEIWLELPENRGPFYTRGEVVWSQALAGTNKQRTGIRLEKAELIGLAPVLWKQL
jgi:hypothetical protein